MRMSRWPCKDYLKGTCTNSFCEKWHPPECLFYYKIKSGCRFGEKCSYAHRQADEQPSKRSKKNDDKSPVAMLKKYELHDRTGQPAVDRDTRRESNHGLVECSSSNTRQLGCVFQDMEPPKLTSILRESSDMPKPIQRVKFTKAVARNTKIRDPNPGLGLICPGEPHQRSPNAPKFEDRSQEETEWQEQGAREAACKLAKSVLKLKENKQSNILRGNCVCQRNGFFLIMKVLENTPAVLSLGKLCDENGYSYEWINGQKPHLIKNGIRIQCNTENFFVPIVVPGLSTSSSSGSYLSISRTPSRQERHCSTSSSSSSSSPTATSSENETREREDRTESDTSPVPMSSFNVDDRTGHPVVGPESNHEPVYQANQKFPKTNKQETMTERGNPLSADSGRASSEIPEWLQEFRGNLVDDEVPERRDSHASSSHEVSLEPTFKRREDLGKHSVSNSKAEIARFVRGPKLQGPRADDAMAKPYLVQKILVT